MVSRIEVRIVKQLELLLGLIAAAAGRGWVASLAAYGGVLSLLREIIVLLCIRSAVGSGIRPVISVAGQETIVVVAGTGDAAPVMGIVGVDGLGIGSGWGLVYFDGDVVEQCVATAGVPVHAVHVHSGERLARRDGEHQNRHVPRIASLSDILYGGEAACEKSMKNAIHFFSQRG